MGQSRNVYYILQHTQLYETNYVLYLTALTCAYAKHYLLCDRDSIIYSCGEQLVQRTLCVYLICLAFCFRISQSCKVPHGTWNWRQGDRAIHSACKLICIDVYMSAEIKWKHFNNLIKLGFLSVCHAGYDLFKGEED